MIDDHGSLADGAELARSVRGLATQARRALNRPASTIDARELLRSINELEEAARDRSFEDLAKWLASLRRQLEEHVLALA